MKAFCLYATTFLGVSLGCLFLIIVSELLIKAMVGREIRKPEGRKYLRVTREGFFLFGLAVLCFAFSFVISRLLTGSFVYGVGLWMGFPLLLSFVMRGIRRIRLRYLERSALSFFYALSGFLKMGMSFPHALFELSRTLKAPFARALYHFLNRYQEGKTLSECLAKFQNRSGLRTVNLCLGVFDMAYRNGLPMVPFLEQAVFLMQEEMNLKEKVISQRNSVFFQAIAVFFLPWGLMFCLVSFEPERLFSLSQNPISVLGLVIVLGWEVLGMVLIWKVSSFY